MLTHIVNAWIFTRAQVFRRGSLLIKDDRIVAVSIEPDAAPAPYEGDVNRVDVNGGYVLPGFVDTHTHLTSIALRGGRCDLSSARSARDVCELLAAWAGERDAARLMGVDWDESAWTDPAPLTRSMLDAIDRRRPLLARRICGHMGVANTPLLTMLAGPPRGLIDRDSGMLREHALWAAGEICQPSLDVMHNGMETAIRSLHALGITAIHDIVEPKKFDAYLTGFRRCRVPFRIDVLLHTAPEELPRYIERARDFDAGRLRIAGVKCFLDGSLGGRTAALNEPYAGTTDRGTLFMTDDDLRSVIHACHEGGYVCAMHAIGDRAIDQAVDAMTGGPADARNLRIEHCEIVGDAQLDGLKRSPAVLAVQPNFVRNWGMRGGPYEQRLGPERFRRCNPWRTLRDAGVPFVFGSDGMPPGPLHGLLGATGHPIEAERLSPAEAIGRYTQMPNEVGMHERDAGSIEQGRLADLVVLDGDPLTGAFDDLAIRRTIVAGETVFDAP